MTGHDVQKDYRIWTIYLIYNLDYKEILTVKNEILN